MTELAPTSEKMLMAALDCAVSDIDEVSSKLKERGLLSVQDEVVLSDAKAVLFEAWLKLEN